jgi:hypothetical protein
MTPTMRTVRTDDFGGGFDVVAAVVAGWDFGAVVELGSGGDDDDDDGVVCLFHFLSWK